MVSLSDAERQVLEELWKLIQSRRTTQVMPAEVFTNETLFTIPEGLTTIASKVRRESCAKDS
jgi:hypothetical protein